MNTDCSSYKSLKRYKGTERQLPTFTCQLDRICVSYFTVKVQPFCVILHLNLDWCFSFLTTSLRGKKKPSDALKQLWNCLSFWQRRQLELIISVNGKTRKRFFASPTSDSSPAWQLRWEPAAVRMFTETDCSDAGLQWMLSIPLFIKQRISAANS